MGYALNWAVTVASFSGMYPFSDMKGETLRRTCRFPENLQVILVNPGIHISTAAAFAAVTPHGAGLPRLRN